MKKATILVVDDDPKVVIFIEDQLKSLGHQVIIARNGKEAVGKVEESQPDLIVLDVMMPEMDGYEVCNRLKSASETQHIPILMLTAKGQLQDKIEGFSKGTDDYLSKPYDNAEFEARVTALLKRSNLSPYFNKLNNSVFSIFCKPDRNLSIRFDGKTSFAAISKKNFDLDMDLFTRYAENARKLLDEWRFQCKDTGKQLYKKIFGDHSQAFSTYHRALEAIESDEKLHFRFETERDFLRIPLEFLFAEEEYLVLKHPFARFINGIHGKRHPLSPNFLNELSQSNEKLRVLLIASNTQPPIPEVDVEIEILQTSIKDLFKEKGLLVSLKTFSTKQATYENVKKELKNCKYHIVHYAGHGYYNLGSPEKSSLYFWEKPDQQGGVIKMPVSELQMLLRNSEIRFVYLSCCFGSATNDLAKLLDDDFLGIADGLVHAGIPAVLGFRYPVSDSGAKMLAHEFYKSLSEHGQIDTALLHARCEVAMKDRNDITWVSPILIMQD